MGYYKYDVIINCIIKYVHLKFMIYMNYINVPFICYKFRNQHQFSKFHSTHVVRDSGETWSMRNSIRNKCNKAISSTWNGITSKLRCLKSFDSMVR